MLNLFNTAALAEQSSFFSTASQTASTGCDADVIMIDTGDSPSSYLHINTKLVGSIVEGTDIAP
jgi:hypothetical protein